MPRSQKEMAVSKIVDHIIEKYKPQESAIVLMWREVMTGFDLQASPDSLPRFPRDGDDVHRHWNQFGRPTARALHKQYRLTVVKVSRLIRDLVGHGRAPDLSTKKNDAAYERCLPSSSAPVLGIVVFPRDTSQDHPLIVLSKARRAQSAGTAVRNSIMDVRDTNDLGCLSGEKTTQIVAATQKTVSLAFNDDRYPLFAKLDEQPKALPGIEQDA